MLVYYSTAGIKKPLSEPLKVQFDLKTQLYSIISRMTLLTL